MLRINLERIMQYLEYDKEDLISLPLGEIIDLDKLSEVKERDAIYQENLAIKDQFKMLFDKYDLFVNLFGEEYVDKYLLRYKLSEITDEYDHLKQYRHGIPQKAVLLKEDVIKYKVIPPARKKETRVVCDVYMIPSPYQGLKHSEIIRKIFADKYPWISEFSYKVYEIRSEIDDFYVNVNEKDSFYVPLKDFMEGNVQNIKNSNYRRLGDALYKNETIMKFLKYIETNKEETHNE
jgi:hypothetical protein